MGKYTVFLNVLLILVTFFTFALVMVGIYFLVCRLFNKDKSLNGRNLLDENERFLNMVIQKKRKNKDNIDKK